MRRLSVVAAICALACACALALAACGNEPSAPAAPEGSAPVDSPALETSSAPVENPLATYDYEGKGQLFFDYPVDTFFVDDSAILPTITAYDASVKITFNPAYTYEVDGAQAQIDYIDGYLSNDDPESHAEDLEVAGMRAHRVWHVDPNWGDLYMRTVIDFGEAPTADYAAINIAVVGTDWDRVNAEDVQAIIESIRLAA